MFSEISAEQARQLIDVEQVFRTYRNAERELATRFAGSMFWQTSHGREYLYRKIVQVRHSLGRRSATTEEAYKAFQEGKARQQEIKDGTKARLKEMAPVNRSLRLGRVPGVAGKILRRLDQKGYLGLSVHVVGTNCLFAYEVAAGVHFESGLIATGDIDLLYDARRRLRLLTKEFKPEGLLAIIQKEDKTFEPLPNGFSAANAKGYMVDLIAPATDMSSERRRSISDENDLVAAEIEGLIWFENSPRTEQIVIAEDGLPLMMSVPDPRVFAAHKLWLASRVDRNPTKKRRDHAQGVIVLKLIRERLHQFDMTLSDLTALPSELRQSLSTGL